MKITYPGNPKAIKEIGFSLKSTLLVGNHNHPKLGTILLIVFDFQGLRINEVYWG